MNTKKIENHLTIVPLGTTFFHGSLISHELIERISHQRVGEKALLLYNRRGSGRAWICEDCGYFPLCPQCDIALAYHSYPSPQCVCHHCSYRTALPEVCPSCGGHGFHEVGIGIQRVATDLARAFSGRRILRIDSDSDMKKRDRIRASEEHDIILTTHAGISLLHIDAVTEIVFLLFESDLTLPDYRMEEDLYHALEYAKKSGKNVMIQTYLPDHPLLSIVTEGNYRDFLRFMTEERQKFHYPPYTDFVVIRIHDGSKDKLEDMTVKLVNKIEIIRPTDVFVAYDHDVIERSRGEWTKKIILKGKNIKSLLDELAVELVRNRSITLEWR